MAHGLKGVRSLTGLGDRQHERALIQHRIAVAELRRHFDLHWDAHPVLNRVLRSQTRVVCRTTRHHEDLVEGLQVTVRDRVLIQHHALPIPVASERIADGGGLLVDLLHHEGIKATLLRSFQVPVNGERLAFARRAVEVEDLVGILRHHHDGVRLQLHRVLRVLNEGSDVGAKEHLTVAHTHDEWGRAACRNDRVRVVSVRKQHGKRALKAVEHA